MIIRRNALAESYNFYYDSVNYLYFLPVDLWTHVIVYQCDFSQLLLYLCSYLFCEIVRGWWFWSYYSHWRVKKIEQKVKQFDKCYIVV